MHDDQFTATGPSHASSGHPRTAFSTKNFSDFEYGVNAQGKRCGVCGVAGEVRDSGVRGVGVNGDGPNFGVRGRADGIAGVFGHANRSDVGVLGAAMRQGIGVVGASFANLGNPLQKFAKLPSRADGPQIGVLGLSGKAAGVLGRSASGPGVKGEGSRGPGVEGASVSDRGGIFSSGRNVPQVQLIPTEVSSLEGARLRRRGRVGDLLLITDEQTCTLWLCVPNPASAASVWRPVLLGDPVTGSA